jgi:membrane-associated phospholipid phosphatase
MRTMSSRGFRTGSTCRLGLEQLEDRLVLSSDMVIQWNDILLDAVRTASTPPPAASRIMAITHAAVYDSVNALARTHQVYLVNALAHPRASKEAAVAAAAHRALVALFPAQASKLNAKLAESLATIPNGKAEDDGVALGQSVADQILASRQNDGSNVVLPPYLGKPEPGQWRPTPPGFAPGLAPQWPKVKPFAMTDSDQFRPVAPPALTSAQYTAAFNEVKELGSATSGKRTADQTAIALFWANGAGTATPPGHLNIMAQIAANQHGNSLEENARLFALLNIGMADAAISCWDAKYVFNYWRPVTGIREAANDGNGETVADPTWTPLIATPPFPGYTSGHSTFSGVTAAVLTSFFGTNDVSFTLPSEDPSVGARSFTSFSQAAAESAVSRLYGGIHWSFDNIVGLTAGTALGQYVVANFLKAVEQTPVAGMVNRELIVIGTDDRDLIRVDRIDGLLVVRANGKKLGAFDAGALAIVVDGRGDDDRIFISQLIGIDSELYGGDGNDLIEGGAGDDRIFGEDGRDILFGHFGNDLLDGGAGDDFLFGGFGDDVLLGGPGDDWLFGGPGRDVLKGGPGRNRLFQ